MPKTNMLAISDKDLPKWSDCELAVDEKTATALQQFIYDYEPSSASRWREQLAALIQEAIKGDRGGASMTTIKEDVDPPIDSLVINDSQNVAHFISVDGGVTRITPYRESDGSIWFTAWMGEDVYKRINGRFVIEVNYSTRS